MLQNFRIWSKFKFVVLLLFLRFFDLGIFVKLNSLSSSNRNIASLLSKSLLRLNWRSYLFIILRLLSWVPHNFINSRVDLCNKVFKLYILSSSQLFHLLFLVSKIELILLNDFHVIWIDQLFSQIFGVSPHFISLTILSKFLQQNRNLLFHWRIPVVFNRVISPSF